jgi:hypothetical protein
VNPLLSRSTLARIFVLLLLLLVVDSVLLYHAVKVTVEKGPSMMIMFGFEVRCRSVATATVKPLILQRDRQRERESTIHRQEKKYVQ